MIKRYIEANLDTALLTADHLCSRFRISRASLYRLFEADGGLARYVQEQRLNRALKQLVSPLAQSKRLIDLAVDLQFSGDSTFIRAFRRRFGVTPGEIRELSETWFREQAMHSSQRLRFITLRGVERPTQHSCGSTQFAAGAAAAVPAARSTRIIDRD
jgi:AraC-like DNA-binding protein